MRILLLLVLLSKIFYPADSSADSLYLHLLPKDLQYWHKLLHSDDRGVSRADGEHFFLSPEGKKDSTKELEATIQAFKTENIQSGYFRYHPQCVFRERFRFLKSMGLLNDVKEQVCPEFDEWKKGLNTDSVTLIFSSSYPNNPSSLFGHTLIRLDQKNKNNDLLDYSVAFSAIPDANDIGIVFAFKGMFGGYQGILDVSKYYVKVNDYNNSESRDLIEYKLKISPDQIDRLINHLWEIYQTTYFDYYFLDENCSSVLADILAVPFNDEKINDHPRWYYLPSDMIKSFWNAKLVESVHFRPSLKKKFEKQISLLSDSEVFDIKKLEYDKSLPVHDGVIAYLDYSRYQTKNNLSEEKKKILRSALIKRSTLPQTELRSETYSELNRPENGHSPRKISLLGRKNQLGFELKQGHHDLMSNDLGFDPFSQFDFLSVSFVYDLHDKKIFLDQYTIVDLVSLHSFTFYDPQISWQATVGGNREDTVKAKAFGGLSFIPWKNSILGVMVGAVAKVDHQYKRYAKLYPTQTTSLLTQLGNQFKLGLFNEFSFQENILSVQATYFSTQNSELRLTGQKQLVQLNYGYFF